ncbi:MAG: PEGA domain-containing protein, partial [Oligoflexia bacterium]|nr:PEGA domain-containing protein [Oligoflexia bacterium]
MMQARLARPFTRPSAIGLALAGLILDGPAWAGGAISVTSQPLGGDILIDGQQTSLKTPATLPGLAVGRHQLQVLGACMTGKLDVDVTEGGTTAVNVPLVPQGGMLQLEVRPPQATIELDGAPLASVNDVPMAVDCGSHTLKVTAAGHETALINVDIEAGRVSTVPVILSAIGIGALAIDIAPDQAAVWMDRRLLGTGPRRVDVTAGPHALRATLDGYLDQERQVVVQSDQTLPVAFSLQTDPSIGASAKRKHHPWFGIGVASLGAAGLAWGTTEYFAAQPGWRDFQDRKTKIESGLWPETYQNDPAAWANDVYYSDVQGHRNRMLLGDIAGGLLLGTGLLLTFTL